MATTREQLIRVGVELVEETGSIEIGLREIARRAGVSHGAPRRYFPTHRALLSAIAGVGLHDLDTAMRTETTGLAGRDAVRAAAAAYLDFARSRPAMFTLMFRHDLLDGAGEDLRSTSRPMYHVLRENLRDALPAPGDAAELALRTAGLWTAVHGVAVLTATGALGLAAPGVESSELVGRAVDTACQAGPLRT